MITSRIWRVATGLLCGIVLTWVLWVLVGRAQQQEVSAIVEWLIVIFMFPIYGKLLILDWLLPDALLQSIASFVVLAFYPALFALIAFFVGEKQTRTIIIAEGVLGVAFAALVIVELFILRL